MVRDTTTAALVALLRNGGKPAWRRAVETLESGGAIVELEAVHGLLAGDALDRAVAEIGAWERRGIRVLSPADAEYPGNLRNVADRPPLLFVAGRMIPADHWSIAVIGSRQATHSGISAAREIARHLVEQGFTVLSGLAAGIDAAAHSAALNRAGRTVAVIGTGLDRCYPPQNAALQHQIADRCAVVSQFCPESAPSRISFPMRNAVMSGLALGTVIVEASHTSGARIQARLALAQGRPVMLLDRLLEQQWAQELAARPGVHVVSSPAEIAATVERHRSAAFERASSAGRMSLSGPPTAGAATI